MRTSTGYWSAGLVTSTVSRRTRFFSFGGRLLREVLIEDLAQFRPQLDGHRDASNDWCRVGRSTSGGHAVSCCIGAHAS